MYLIFEAFLDATHINRPSVAVIQSGMVPFTGSTEILHKFGRTCLPPAERAQHLVTKEYASKDLDGMPNSI